MSVQKSNRKLNVVFGDWDKNTVRLDFDCTPLSEVKLWALRVNEWFNLDGFIILQSSQRILKAKDRVSGKVIFRCRKRSFNVVFNRRVSWSMNVKIMNWVALESANEGLQDYVRMQCIKGTSTLRLSNKGRKSCPKVVFSYGNWDKQILKFLETKKFVSDFLENLNNGVINDYDKRE